LIHAWWQGKLAHEKLESIATNKCERAELYFYSGYKAMRSGDLITAQTAFHKTIEQNTYRFIERPLAKSFLANIK
jgi:lipoprotein NlpI